MLKPRCECEASIAQSAESALAAEATSRVAKRAGIARMGKISFRFVSVGEPVAGALQTEPLGAHCRRCAGASTDIEWPRVLNNRLDFGSWPRYCCASGDRGQR